MNKTEKIAQLNDQLRSSFLGGKVLLTCVVNEHPLREQVITAVRTFDETMIYLSPDPADPTITNRVMTIMRADEY